MSTMTPIDEAVELVPLRETVWRVCDRTRDDGDARRILGYLDRLDDGYEMLWMRPHPGATRRYATMDAALDAITRRTRSLA